MAKGLPPEVKIMYARADSGFYCWQAVQAYEKLKWRFIVVVRKTAGLVDELQTAKWKRSPLTDADGQCEFFYQPEGWGKDCRFLALRYEKPPQETLADAGLAVAELVEREAELHPEEERKVKVEGIEELVADKGYLPG